MRTRLILSVFQAFLGFALPAFADSANGETANTKVYTDHLGYDKIGPKYGVVEVSSGNPNGFYCFELIKTQDQEVVFTADLESAGRVQDWNNHSYLRADFSAFDGEGTFKLRVKGQNGATFETQPFEIASALHFHKTFDKTVDYFYRSRAVTEPSWSWDKNLRIIGNYGMNPVNLQGGWYDASGDISKYLSHLSFANFLNPQQIPLTAWALADLYEKNDLLPQNRPDQAQRLLSEAQFGADFLVKMLSPEGYFYISVFDQWKGDQGNRTISVPVNGSVGTQSPQVQAAFREGGGMAIASLARTSRLSAASNPSLADRYLQAAQRAFAHLETNNRNYCDNGKENIIDDYTALLAATELAITTGDQQYKVAAQKRAQNLVNRLSPEGYFFSDSEDVPAAQRSRPFWHASDAGLPVVALARYLDLETDAELISSVKQTIKSHLDYQVRVNKEVSNPFNYARQHFRFQGNIRSGFFIPHENETTYWWQGENARLGSLAAAAIIGGRKVYSEDNSSSGLPKDLLAVATDQIAWILGKNPYDVSFMESEGRNNPPPYSVAKAGHSHLPGGISNGITGRVSNKISEGGRDIYIGGDGTGIAWNPSEANPPRAAGWENWRWVEQWLPHTTWYMLAISALAELDVK